MEVIADFNILTPTDYDTLVFNPYKQALGDVEWERIQTQLRFYAYYDGRQHVDPRTGQFVRADELERPAGLDYDPTRYATNYFKTFIQRKSRWQMGGTHGITVKAQQIDKPIDTLEEGYKPSPAQLAENERAHGFERLLYQLWNENKMREKLLQASRDRLIAGDVVAKLAFNPRTGKLHIIFRPITEFIAVRSDDDFNEMIAGHFIQSRKGENGEELIWKQTFTLDNGVCYLEEALYDDSLRVVKVITPKTSMGITFLPIVTFPVNDLSNSGAYNMEALDLKAQNDILNQLNEDAIDSLKFEMFSMTALIGVPEGTANKVQIAPASVLEISGGMTGAPVQVTKVEGGFRWKDAYADTYARVKGAMHEITHLPQIVPQELNFGGLNGEALQVLYHSIIQETAEHWLVWQERLQELHTKAIMYLQARSNGAVFAYDKSVLKAIGADYTHEINFVLPLPDNRTELVNLLTLETASGFESNRGALERLGVTDVDFKIQQIKAEKQEAMKLVNPYGDGMGKPPMKGAADKENTDGEDKNA